MDVSLLGPIEVRLAGRSVSLGTKKQRALLALLALHVNTPVASDRLVEGLWGERPPPTAHKMVQLYVSQLRRALAANGGGTRIVTRGRGYELRLGPDDVDARRFERLVAEGAPREALALWRGPPLADVADEPFAAAEIRRLDEMRLAAVELAIERDLAAGRHREVVGELEALVAEEPLRERLHAQLMLALYRCGRQADALAAYRHAHRTLVEQIGVEPGPELARLHQATLAHDPALEPPPSGAAGEALPSGVVTFLLTDIEGSTRLWEADPEAMAAALEIHDELIARTVEVHGGRLLKAKGEGDATMSVFRRASDAVAGATDLEAALAARAWPAGLELRVRIALHTGEAYERDGDYFGPTLNRAARLRALARGGTTVVSQATAEVVRDRLPAGLALADVGEHELRGLARRERVFELRNGAGDRAPESGPVRLALPRPLRQAGSRFVGRADELARLRDLWSRTPGGQRAVFVAGEPGIGKTRLAAELAAAAHAEGALVLYGCCDEGLAVPYQPFVAALGIYVDGLGLDRLRGDLGRLASDLAWLLPELEALGQPPQSDPETERWRLFEAVAALLEAATRDRPALLVLDDLHWATGPTLLLLRHVIRSERPLELLALGTYRATELDPGHPLARLLADFERDSSAATVGLRGLGERAIAELLEAAAGHALDERASALVGVLRTATGGNPFYIREVLAHLVESGAIYRDGERWTAAEEVEVPAGLRRVIEHRVARMSEPARRALAVAAVAGQTCSLPLLEHVVGTEPRLPDTLEEAVAAGLLVDVGGGEYGFAHALVPQTIYRGLGSARRMRLHRRLGEALEALVDVDAHAEALAHHFAQAAADGQVAKAADYALAAGRSATARVGYEEAAAHYERGLEALALAQPPDPERRCELLLALGEARWNLGDGTRAQQACLWAAELAERLDDAARLARAALTFCGPSRITYTRAVGQSGLDLLERALAALGEAETPLRARAMARLALSLSYVPAHRERRRALADGALAMARRIGEPAALAEALAANHEATWGPDNAAERLALTRELAGRAAELGDSALAATAHARSAGALLELADVDASRRELQQLERLAEALQQSYPRWFVAVARATRAYLEGRLEDCEALAQAAAIVGRGWNEDTAMAMLAIQLLHVRLEQGRFEEAVEYAERIAEHLSDLPTVRIGLAHAYARCGRHADARREVERLAHGDFGEIPRDAVWLASMSGLCEVAALLDDAHHARPLYALLLPYADRCALITSVDCLGSTSRPLGLVATTLSRLDDAARHFETALAINARIQSPLWIAHTQHGYAQALLRRGGPGDREHALDLLDAALATADKLGLKALADTANGLKRQADAVGSA